MQQIIAFVIVSIAAIYLARNFVRALRSFISAAQGESEGCSGGCPGCGSAKSGAKVAPGMASRPGDVIRLTEIRTLPSRPSEPTETRPMQLH